MTHDGDPALHQALDDILVPIHSLEFHCIGAGAGCDGQILVLQDLLGMNPDFHPKFARPFLDGARCVLDAVAHFDEAVKAGTFPAIEESYS